MSPQRTVQPARGILCSGIPIIEEYEIETADNCYPGRLVEPGTGTHQVVVGTSGSSVIIGVLDTEPDELRTTIYVVDTQARVLRGDIVVLLKAVSGAAISMGEKVQCATAGMVIESTDATKAVGVAEEAKSGDDAEWILVKLTGI